MIGKASQAQQKPTALGIMTQASVYGAVISWGFGLFKTPLYLIWLNHLRKHGSDKKGKKAKKKGPPTYAANVDMLIGMNPILGVLQIWNNNEPRYQLDMGKSQIFVPLFSVPSVTITDPNFYAVIAVTVENSYDVTFDDYGGPGPVHLTGTFETPCFNSATLGPNPSLPPSYRYAPYTYSWNPTYGPTIVLDDQASGLGSVFYNKNVKIYYAAYYGATKNIPLNRIKCTFEPQLGDGSEYTGYESQQIIYSNYAGIGSDRFDLGATASPPAIKGEVLWPYGIFPGGDALFPDMISAVISSGQLQAAYDSSISLAEHQGGANCYDYPIIVQQKFAGALEDIAGLGVKPLVLTQPLQTGDVIIVFSVHRGPGAPTTPTDSAGNIYTPIATNGTGYTWGVYYAIVPSDQPAGVVVNDNGHDYNHSFGLMVIRGDGLEFDTVSESIFTSPGAGEPFNPNPITITSFSNRDSFIFDFTTNGLFGTGITYGDPEVTQWQEILPLQDPPDRTPGYAGWGVVVRRVSKPGTYSLTGARYNNTGTFYNVMFSFKSSNPRSVAYALGNIVDEETFKQSRLQCLAYGLHGAVAMTSQRSVSEWVQMFCDAGNIAPLWSGFSLKLIPLAEASAVGNGATYISPTAAGPLFNLSTVNGHFIAAEDQPPLKWKRTAQTDQPTTVQMQINCRANDYNNTLVTEPISGDTAIYGPRKAEPRVMECVTDVTVARQLNQIQGRVNSTMNRRSWTFTLPASFILFEGLDLVTVTDPLQGVDTRAVRFSEVNETADGTLECTADEFTYGLYTPGDVVATNPNGQGQGGGDPGSVNAPIIFQPVPRLCENLNQPQLWLVVSAADPDYGGCVVYISTDGGNSYNVLGSIVGNAITGYPTNDWPASADPDTTNDLPLNLSESRGQLQSYTTTDEDNFTYPCYVSGGVTCIPYELMTYAVADLTAQYQYTLRATGTGGGTSSTTLALQTGHNSSADPAYNKTNDSPDMFDGTPGNPNVTIDDTKTDDSQNAITPCHLSDVKIDNMAPGFEDIPKSVHVTPWWGSGSHPDIGFPDFGDNTYIDAFLTEIFTTFGFDYIIYDWYGSGSFEDTAVLNVNSRATSTSFSAYKYMIMIDKGAISGTGGTATTSLENAIAYANTTYFSDPRYIKVGGRPVLMFFGVSQISGIDMAAAKTYAASHGNPLFIDEGTSVFSTSWGDGGFAWVSPYNPPNGNPINPSDPYHLTYLDGFISAANAHPGKYLWLSAWPGFDGTCTRSTGWSLGKILQRDGGKCWIEAWAHSVTKAGELSDPTQLAGWQVPTYDDWQEGSIIESGIENWASVTTSITTNTLNWSISFGLANISQHDSGGTATVDHYRIWISSDGVSITEVADVSTDVSSYDLTSIPNLTTGSPYHLYVEAVGISCVRNHMSSGSSWVSTVTTGAGSSNYLRRAVFNAPQPGQGVDHPLTSPPTTRFAFLNPAGTGILKQNLDTNWIGKTLYFKFCAFNLFGGQQQSPDDVSPYTYTVISSCFGPDYTQTPPFALSNPSNTTIAMVQVKEDFGNGMVLNYNARGAISISAPGSPTWYYVTIADPNYQGDTGTGTNLTAYAETNTSKVGVGGYIYIGAIKVIPGGGGTQVSPGGWPPPQGGQNIG